jgi:hypothetical protein
MSNEDKKTIDLCKRYAENVRRHTAENDHDRARVLVAEWFACEQRRNHPEQFNIFCALSSAFSAIAEEHERVGELSAKASELRYSLTVELRNAARFAFPEQAEIILAAL